VTEEVSPYIGLEIKAPYDRLMAAREKAFMKLQDEQGMVLVKVPECGCNMLYQSVDEFPKTNARCLCKNRRHFLVKFTVTD